jgi:hypothetical protein
MTTPRENQTATLLPDGQVLMAGGTNFDHPHAAVFLASAELYPPWRRLPQTYRSARPAAGPGRPPTGQSECLGRGQDPGRGPGS